MHIPKTHNTMANKIARDAWRQASYIGYVNTEFCV